MSRILIATSVFLCTVSVAHAQVCPLAVEQDPALCTALQAEDCASNEPGGAECWVDVARIVAVPPSAGVIEVLGCACHELACGPVSINDTILSCQAGCPNGDPLTDCFIHIDGQSSGLFAVDALDLLPDSLVTCGCAFPPIVACCEETLDVTCQQTTPAACLAFGGTPMGSDSQCLGHEACCLADGSCTFVDRLCCEDLGGSPGGAGSDCAFTKCAPPGPRACPGGTIAECADLDGDAIRDDNCVWWACDVGLCLPTAIDYADMGGANGACTPDGTADVNDRFHALNCFSNQTTLGVPGYLCEQQPPAAFNVDAAGLNTPCIPDGVCDGNDAFAAINAFEGSSTCSCPSGPAPRPPAEDNVRPRRRKMPG